MQVLTETGLVVDDPWHVHTEPVSSLAPGQHVLPLDCWRDFPGHGLLLEVDAELEDDMTSAPLIAVNFPAFNDGRGLSLAVLLRSRLCFAGELRAIGDVHPDVLNYMIRCGFDSFVLSDDRKPQTALDRFRVQSDYYQASVTQPLPAFRRRNGSAFVTL